MELQLKSIRVFTLRNRCKQNSPTIFMRHGVFYMCLSSCSVHMYLMKHSNFWMTGKTWKSLVGAACQDKDGAVSGISSQSWVVNVHDYNRLYLPILWMAFTTHPIYTCIPVFQQSPPSLLYLEIQVILIPFPHIQALIITPILFSILSWETNLVTLLPHISISPNHNSCILPSLNFTSKEKSHTSPPQTSRPST